jgi:Fur family ferric uptake transcriptional regulator
MPAPGTTSEALLSRVGLRRTPARMGVLDLLAKTQQAMSVQEILEKLPAYTDGVTVYRTLNTLTAKKILHRVRNDERGSLFALGAGEGGASHRHAHFVCDDCGRTECLEETELPRDLPANVKAGRGYRVKYAELVLHGSCPNCRK